MATFAPPPCLFCGSCDQRPRFQAVRDRLGHAPGTWNFDACQKCGSGLLRPVPKADELPSFYPPVYSFTPELGQAGSLKRWLAGLEYRLFYAPQYQQQVRIVCQAVGPQAGGELLDVGCGRGLRLEGFRRRGYRVVGADFQPEVVEELRGRGISAVVSDIDHLANHFAENRFDLITAFYLLEHVPDVAATVRGCWKLLKPGGWFAAAVPLLDGLEVELFGSRWIHVGEAPRHLSLPSSTGLKEALVQAGYVDVKLRPDAALNCAGVVASSLIPAASLTAAYGGAGGSWALVRRLLGGGVSLLATPLVWLENHVLRRPSHGIIFGRKPGVWPARRCPPVDPGPPVLFSL